MSPGVPTLRQGKQGWRPIDIQHDLRHDRPWLYDPRITHDKWRTQ